MSDNAIGGFDPVCPACDTALVGEYGEGLASASEETLHAPDCPDCGAVHDGDKFNL